jgi:hypothetical protein
VLKFSGCSNPAEGIILVHERHAEHRHHRVSDELLDGPPVPVDASASRVIEARENVPHGFGIESFADRRRAANIREEDRHYLSRLMEAFALLERRSTTEAESGPRGIAFPASSTDPNGRTVPVGLV